MVLGFLGQMVLGFSLIDFSVRQIHFSGWPKKIILVGQRFFYQKKKPNGLGDMNQ